MTLLGRKQQYKGMLLAGFLASSINVCCAQTGAPPTTGSAGAAPQQATASPAAPATAPALARIMSDYHTVGSPRAEMKYLAIWGIDNLKLEPTASGSLIRFSYRVVDAQKAQALNDKQNEPFLLLQRTGTKLGIHQAERVGRMRQVSTPESGREYWMAFGNGGHQVQPGDRVDIVIGPFHAVGLYVEAPEVAQAKR